MKTLKVKYLALRAKMNKSKSLTISVKGNCMNPLLCSGDKLEVVMAKKHLIGRLYLYETSNMDLAVHRLIETDKNILFLKGDSTRGYECINSGKILGEVKMVRFYGYSSWIDINRLDKYSGIVVKASKLIAKDKYSVTEKRSRRCISLLIKKMIVARGALMRYNSLKKCKRETST